MRATLQILLLALAFTFARADEKWAKSYTETGNASFYTAKQTHKTASGEWYAPSKLTGAHRKLPIGTTVKVTNLRNGKSVTVYINDRGPYRKHRIIDLSVEAAKQLDMIKAGTVKVKVAVVDLPKTGRF